MTIINTNNPGKRRNHELRTIAEILRKLGQKQDIDAETKDMAATIVYCLRTVNATIEESVLAWEKRNYFKKADDFQEKWRWTNGIISKLETILRTDNWAELPAVMTKLFPHFADVEINKSMRTASDWEGNYERLMAELVR